ncbi:hypothetical protein KSP39_PZI019514 [Platanthera zijinensis]|uniref:Uncharacterized protein n=1 Tax=Platanthera zijinensis TaxID=2320716 RepID=A0AAP0B251_9ASPA
MEGAEPERRSRCRWKEQSPILQPLSSFSPVAAGKGRARLSLSRPPPVRGNPFSFLVSDAANKEESDPCPPSSSLGRPRGVRVWAYTCGRRPSGAVGGEQLELG